LREKRISNIVEEIPPEGLKTFYDAGYTIGGMMVFPGNQIDGKMTINQARGCNGNIKDRFDLTVECIRIGQRSSRSSRRIQHI
jgi:hypothetical protein